MGVSAGGGARISFYSFSLEGSGAFCLVAGRTRREELNKAKATGAAPI